MVIDSIIDDNVLRIRSHISRLHSLLENSETDLPRLNCILDDLNAVNTDCVGAEEKFTCIRLCCSIITPSDAMLTGKCGQVVLKFIREEKVTEELAVFIIQWCLQAIMKSPDISQVELLRVLEFMFETEFGSHKELIDSVLKVLQIPLESKSKLVFPDELLLHRLYCIRAMIPMMNTNHLDVVKDMSLELMQSNLDNNSKPEVLLALLEILQMICERNNSWLSDNVGVILGVSLALSSFGLPHHVCQIPRYILPTPLLPESKSDVKKSNKVKNRRKPKKSAAEKIKSAPVDEIPEINWSLSESDFSDSENSRAHQQRKSERKIRLSALSLLLYVIKTVGKKEVVGYWDNILSGPYSILKTLSNDTSPRSRVAITAILGILISTGKMYISQAQHNSKNTNTPYVSWSQLLSDLITLAHETLCDLARQSQSVVSLLSILNCLIVFIRNIPYHRLSDGLIRNIVHSVTPLLRHVDFSIRNSAIKCMTEFVILEPNTEEQILLIRTNQMYPVPAGRSDSWIILYCLESLKNDKLSVNVKSECWLLLGCLAKHHFITNVSGENLDEMVILLRKDLQDSNIMVQKNAAKAFEQIAIPMGAFESSCGVSCYNVWLSMLQGPLVPMLQSTSGILAAAAADCIAAITCSIFQQLPERLRIFIMTALFGCVGHEEHLARSAAARTLGTIVVFPFLSHDIQIIYDVADRIVCALNDDNLMVRMKAAWALGNLSDVLLSGREIGVPIEEVPLLNVLDIAVRTGSDHEKVKACSMRAIGNLFLLVEDQHLKIEKFRLLVDQAATTLNTNSSTENNMKVRWNACYSLGNMFKNELLLLQVDTGWQFQTFQTFTKLIVNCTNFKVRQAASTALSMISKREHYGDYYLKLWPALFKAFDNSQNLPDFAEYKHQRNLVDQLCFLLCHLSNFLTVDDISTLHSISIAENLETYVKHIVEVKKRNTVVTDKFSSAAQHVGSLLSANLSSEQTKIIQGLRMVLVAAEE
ncbi:HEAT repeat-containing protein 6 [Planococcus citri]|uniref:HEAT repeat-containing protein 6 n=1 Tax=Planococcus citri TaxID=170843 RepID=UPI0031F96A4B